MIQWNVTLWFIVAFLREKCEEYKLFSLVQVPLRWQSKLFARCTAVIIIPSLKCDAMKLNFWLISAEAVAAAAIFTCQYAPFSHNSNNNNIPCMENFLLFQKGLLRQRRGVGKKTWSVYEPLFSVYCIYFSKSLKLLQIVSICKAGNCCKLISKSLLWIFRHPFSTE